MPMAAQTPAAAPKKAPAKAYTPSRTPGATPICRGVYTNKDENGIPVERPSQFDGKKLEDVDESEFAEVVKERNEASVTRAPGIGGAETGAGPVHWYEHYDAKNSRPWLVIDPADGRIPPTTPEAEQRAAAPRGGARRPRPGGLVRGSQPLRSVHHARPSGSMMPAIYGNSYQIHQAPGLRGDPLRDDPRDAHHPARRPRARRTRRSRPTWAMRADTGTATRWSSRPPISCPRRPNRGASEKLRLVERFKPVGPNQVEWSVTFEDAATWARPWTFAMNLTKDATQAPFEYACHEGNYGLHNILSAARAEEQGPQATPAPQTGR